MRKWIQSTAPDEPREEKNYDHVPNLLLQLARTPKERPTINIDANSIDGLTADDISLEEYEPHASIDFGVAE
jgi:thymidylate synthase